MIVTSTIIALALWLWVSLRRYTTLEMKSGRIKLLGWLAILLMAICCVSAVIGIIGLQKPALEEAISLTSANR